MSDARVTRKNVLIRSRRLGVTLGVVALIGGAFLLYDAYERRGVRRPFPLRLIPG